MCTLTDICNRYIKKEKQIDLLSIDTEGYDLQVLRSLDWMHWRPKMVICEINTPSELGTVNECQEIKAFLDARKYKYLRSFGCNSVYVDTLVS